MYVYSLELVLNSTQKYVQIGKVRLHSTWNLTTQATKIQNWNGYYMLRFCMLQEFSQPSQTTTQLSPASTNIFPLKKLLNTIEALANGCAHLVWFQHLSLRAIL